MHGKLVRWLVGVDAESRVAASAGVAFHPLPPAAHEVLKWGPNEIEQWEREISPALLQMETDYEAELKNLRPLRRDVNKSARPFFNEIVDGIEVTKIRARHARHVYGALVVQRKASLEGKGLSADALRLLHVAEEDTKAARRVVRRRERAYRYKPLARSVGGGPLGQDDANWTVYPYRYLNRTHHLTYYRKRGRGSAQSARGRGCQCPSLGASRSWRSIGCQTARPSGFDVSAH